MVIPDTEADPDLPTVLVEPRHHDWDETSAQAARYDRLYWNRDED